MKKGIFQTLIFYCIGFGLAGLIYLIVGHPYIHAPGYHHLILLLTLIVGFVWGGICLWMYFTKRKRSYSKGAGLIHTIVLAGSFLYVFIPIYIENNKKPAAETDSIRTNVRGDTTELYFNGNLVFIRVKDSVLLDLTEGRLD